uniref:Uncharacterized protein n=1 Tax=Arundo donax TaxID=35708 RepID=A0A0A9HDM8_ARUDO
MIFNPPPTCVSICWGSHIGLQSSSQIGVPVGLLPQRLKYVACGVAASVAPRCSRVGVGGCENSQHVTWEICLTPVQDQTDAVNKPRRASRFSLQNNKEKDQIPWATGPERSMCSR